MSSPPRLKSEILFPFLGKVALGEVEAPHLARRWTQKWKRKSRNGKVHTRGRIQTAAAPRVGHSVDSVTELKVVLLPLVPTQLH